MTDDENSTKASAAMRPIDPSGTTATCRCGRNEVLVRVPRGAALCGRCWLEMAEGGTATARRRPPAIG